jgi:predicted glycoside hydrolase/deacetylase ChbG (UPF0249 family)
VPERLTVTADDYGYSARYDEGILAAVDAEAVDAVGAMVLRDGCDPGPLGAAGVEVGLHLELPEAVDADPGSLVEGQAGEFEDMFSRPPDFIDGHHHLHAAARNHDAVVRLARRLGVRVRSIGAVHRQRLRAAGVSTPDRLIGRLRASEALVPIEIAHVEGGGDPAPGWTEWMVHPGLADPEAGSSFDREREDDLAELLRLAPDQALRRWRGVPSG